MSSVQTEMTESSRHRSSWPPRYQPHEDWRKLWLLACASPVSRFPTLAARPSKKGLRRPRVTLAAVSSQRVPGGVVHKLPADLRVALIANSEALAAWKDITPLARNEFICWVEDAKQDVTRKRRIRRTREELEEGQRRPCCWPGCKHRERTGR